MNSPVFGGPAQAPYPAQFPTPAEVIMELGNFQIDMEMRTLRRNGEEVRLGSRAFDILTAVASADGRLVTKNELMDAVWPDTVVEENNIQVHLSALRKALGADRNLILTVPGRGYQLVRRTKPDLRNHTSGQGIGEGRLPPPRDGLLGRDVEIGLIRAMMSQAHLVTLVGAGGIGKTRLAIEVAHQIATESKERVCFVELAAVSTQDAVFCAICESCGFSLPDAKMDVKRLSTMLAGRPTLMLLDNAEHVVGAVARIVDTLMACNASLRIIVTSREPLRVMAENVFRVDPLDVPPPESVDADILRCSAVKLFLQRANSLRAAVATDTSEIRLVGEICRRLDGIPLAIELAAARVIALGVEGVCRRLDDRMAILAGGYRTALPRHQTLRATFDWSFVLLDPATQAVFRRLALFSGQFSFESLCAVVCDTQYTTSDAIYAITDLVAKSLISVEFEGATVRYRLSESSRAYALEKLAAEGELREIVARNSRYLARCLQTHACSSTESANTASGNALDLQRLLDDSRSAFDWAFGIDGDSQAGLELALHLTGVLLDAGFVQECRTRATQAVEALQKLPSGKVDATCEKHLRAAMAVASPHLREPNAKQPDNAARRQPTSSYVPGATATTVA